MLRLILFGILLLMTLPDANLGATIDEQLEQKWRSIVQGVLQSNKGQKIDLAHKLQAKVNPDKLLTSTILNLCDLTS